MGNVEVMGVSYLDERRPHVLIHLADESQVIPVSLLRDVIEGRQEPDALEMNVLLRIAEEWLNEREAAL